MVYGQEDSTPAATRMSGNAALDDSLRLLQTLQDNAEQSWRAYQEEERHHLQQPLGPQPVGASAGSPELESTKSVQPGKALLTPPTKAPGEAEALELQLSALQRKLAAVWRRDLSGPSNAVPLRLRASPPISGDTPTALPSASIKSPNRLQSPFRLGASAPPLIVPLACLLPLPAHPSPTSPTHPPPRGRRAIGAQFG